MNIYQSQSRITENQLFCIIVENLTFFGQGRFV